MPTAIIPSPTTPAVTTAPTTPTNLSEYYGAQGVNINPTQTAADRFALPGFADAAKSAGYDLGTYHVNMQNADANNKILQALIASGGPTTGGSTTGSSTGTTAPKIDPATGLPIPDPTQNPVGKAYQLPSGNVNPDEQSAEQAYLAYLDKQTSPVNEDQIRSDTLKQFQAEIDATNELYAQKLRDAQVTGAGRIGSNTAVQARRGLLGSDFGAAETDTVNNGNTQVYNGINDEKNAAIQAILSKSNNAATTAIAAKNTAMEQGLDARLKYYQDADTRAKSNASDAATFIYNQGVGLSDLTPDQIKTTAANYGITPDQLTAAYNSVKTSGDAAKVKAAKDAEVSVGAGSDVYALQPDGTLKKLASGSTSDTKVLGTGQILYSKNADGTYSQSAAGPAKTAAAPAAAKPLVSNGKTISKDQIGQINSAMEANKGTDGFMDPYVYQQEYKDWTSKFGLNGADFIKQFPPKQFVNPKATNLPSYLMPPKTKAATTRAH